MNISGYKAMWLVVLFDLPTTSKKAKQDYVEFRKGLLEDGFNMLQWSVYARPCPTEENMDVHVGRIVEMLPPRGQVRVFLFTDKQFERQRIFWGKRPRRPEKQPSQLTFF